MLGSRSRMCRCESQGSSGWLELEKVECVGRQRCVHFQLKYVLSVVS